MPLPTRKSAFLRHARLVAAHHRTRSSDRNLATILAGVAGCANAGGFIMLGGYTSHMTGYLSQVADNIVLQNLHLVVQSVYALAMFVCGSAFSAIAINWARQHQHRRQYALPIGLQGGMFLCLAALGPTHTAPVFVNYLGLGLLCFIMGFQNATITKISSARIRTTHATGMITDLGIELGKAIYGFGSRSATISADRGKALLLLQLVLVFLTGGIVGAVGYGLIGYYFSLPLAFIMLAVAFPARR